MFFYCVIYFLSRGKRKRQKRNIRFRETSVKLSNDIPTGAVKIIRIKTSTSQASSGLKIKQNGAISLEKRILVNINS